jgi:hypothetical protein
MTVRFRQVESSTARTRGRHHETKVRDFAADFRGLRPSGGDEGDNLRNRFGVTEIDWNWRKT